MDKHRLEDIWFYCTRAELQAVHVMDAAGMKTRLETLEGKGHSGPVCISIGDEMDPVVQWLMLDKGKMKLVFQEGGLEDTENLIQTKNVDFGDGTMEVFTFSRQQMTEVRDILVPPKIKNTKDAGCLSTLEDVRDILTQMFGAALADRIMEKQFHTLDLKQESLTCVDVRMVVDSLIEKVFREFVGPKKAKEAARKFDAYFAN